MVAKFEVLRHAGEEVSPEERLQKHRRAGKILREIRDEAAARIKPGARLIEIAEFVESRIREAGAEPAFPCNISRNHEAAHYTPKADDPLVFGEDIVKLDVGAQVDGFIADTAVTVDLSGRHGPVVEAARKGLEAAIATVRAGVSTADIGAAIERAIGEFGGVKPVGNLSGHGLERYTQHAPPSIPNRATPGGPRLRSGQTVAIEPFATTGAGRVKDGSAVEIVMLTGERPVRLAQGRAVQAELRKFRGLPVAKRWLKSPQLELGLRQLKGAGVLYEYPVLVEVAGGPVAQFEHSVIVTDDGCEVFT
ncbi:MAG: type II methionyl aminopeptidase [Halobacteria archaeon]